MRFILFSLILFLSCDKKDDGYTIFKIKKGNHKSSSKLEFTDKKEFTFKVQFNESAIYDLNDPENQWDVNKLIGISDGALHQKNSARFGWRWVDNNLEILAYTHYKGNFYFKKITNVEIGKEYDCILLLNDNYTFICNDITITMPRDMNIKTNNYYLWPYFGGNLVAPQDIKIKIKY